MIRHHQTFSGRRDGLSQSRGIDFFLCGRSWLPALLIAAFTQLGLSGSVAAGGSSSVSPDGTFAPPQWVALTQISDPNPVAGAHFGAAVAMSGDVLVVGAPLHDFGSAEEVGSAYVFRRDGRNWVLEEAFISPGPENLEHFGAAVAVFGDHLMIGAPDKNFAPGGSLDAGAVYFYKRDPASGSWSLNGGSGVGQAGARYGAAVAMSSTLAVAGLPGYTSPSLLANAGALSTFTLVNGSWEPAGFSLSALTPSAGARLGSSVALFESFSGLVPPVLAAGAPGFDAPGAVDGGALYVFQKSGGDWNQFQALLLPNAQAGDAFGTSVAAGYNRVFGGSPMRDNPGGSNQAGSVSVFGSSGAAFSAADEVFATNGSSGARFGDSVAFNFDGETERLLIGAPLGNQGGSATDSGSAFVFQPASLGNDWFQADRLSLGAAALDNDQLGAAVAIAGRYAAVGVPRRDIGALTDTGIVEIFTTDEIFADGFE